MINKERKIKKKVNEGIGIEQWGEYFRGMLRGVENRVIGKERRSGEEEEKKEELLWEKVRKAIRRLTKRKAMGMDGTG